MTRVTIGGIIKTSIVTAFTIASALIWKDVIEGAIRYFMPSESQLIWQFIVAIIATVFVVIAIYVILKTEGQAEIFMQKLNKNKK